MNKKTNKSTKKTHKRSDSLAMSAMKDIPSAKSNAKEITGIVKESGKTTGYQISGDKIVSREQGVKMAKAGQLKGVGIATNKGSEYIKSLPDSKHRNNLSDLPTISAK